MNKEKEIKTKKKTKDFMNDPGPFWMSPDRIVALTDGVFAITMTLLVLELHAETLFHLEEWIEFYSYALGFFSLGVYWILHHYIFHFIKRSTGGLIWLNIIFLATSSMVPFWTRVLNLGDKASVSSEYLAFYFGLYMIIVNLILLGLWQFATTNKYLVGRDFDMRIIPPFKKVIIIGTIIVAISSIGGIIYPMIGFFLFAAAAWFLITTIYGPHKIFK
jgi:uncharacterized membrane protein